MTKLFACFCATLLAVGSVAVSQAGQEYPSPTRGCPYPLERADPSPKPEREKLIMAIISTIDRHRGFVELDSELGMLQAHAPPVELKGLHVGDKLLVQVAEGEPPHPRKTPTS